MWPWCVMMVLKVVTGRGKRTLKIYSPERPYRCWHICTSCNALQGVFRFVCAFIFPSPVMRIVDGLSWSWPYRSGNILTVGGLRNLKQILAGFQIPAASWPPPALLLWVAILPLVRELSSTSHHQAPPPTFCGEIQTSAVSLLHWMCHSVMPTMRDSWVSIRRVTRKVDDQRTLFPLLYFLSLLHQNFWFSKAIVANKKL